MDAQLILLQEIKTAVWVLIYLVGAGVLLSLLRAVAASYRTIKSELANAFTNTATSMFERGKYEELMKQWGRAGYRELRKRGVSVREAWHTSKSAHGPWRLTKTPALALALPVRYFSNMGLPTLAAR